jgi:hypothetical protein
MIMIVVQSVEWMIGSGSRSTLRKPIDVSRCLPQIPDELTRIRTEPGPSRWEAGDSPPELRRGLDLLTEQGLCRRLSFQLAKRDGCITNCESFCTTHAWRHSLLVFDKIAIFVVSPEFWYSYFFFETNIFTESLSEFPGFLINEVNRCEDKKCPQQFCL